MAAALSLHSLGLGLVADDLAQRDHILAHLRSEHGPGRWWEIFGYRGKMVDHKWLMFVGMLPWWSSSNASVALLRPLSAATHYLDYWLWPSSPWLMHLHNMAWYVGLVALVSLLYRRLMGATVPAVIAILAYAANEAHAETVAWIAGRNTIITAVFVVITVLLFDRARRVGSTAAFIGVPIALLLAQLASEGGITAWAYIVPYSLLLDAAPISKRIASLLPSFVVTLAYQTMHRILGYGASGNDLYVDPFSEPTKFFWYLPWKLALGVGEQLGVPGAALGLFPLGYEAKVIIQHVLSMLLIGIVLYPLRRGRMQLFWGLGMLLSLIPATAVGFMANPRLLLLPGIGAFALIGMAIERLVFNNRLGAAGLVRRASAGALICVHVPLAMLLSATTTLRLRAYADFLEWGASTLPRGPDVKDKVLAVLNTPHFFMTALNLAYYFRDLPGPMLGHVIGASTETVKVTRPEERVLHIEPTGGYLNDPWSILVRSTSQEFKRGEVFELAHLRVTVGALTEDGRPAWIRVEPTSADAETVTWVVWLDERRGYGRFELPAVGESITLQATMPGLGSSSGAGIF